MTPFPIPLTTPPETMMYFVMTIEIVGQGRSVVSQPLRRVTIMNEKIRVFFNAKRR